MSKLQSNIIKSNNDNDKLLFIDNEFENENEKKINDDNDIGNKNDNSFNTNNFNNESDEIDNNGLDENTRNIYLNYSRSPNPLKNTKKNNRIFIKKKYLKNNINEYKGSLSKDFYYEPSLEKILIPLK